MAKPHSLHLQIDFTEEAFRELEELKARAGFPTRTAMFQSALRLLQWTAEQYQNGSKILLEKDSKITEVVFPFFTRRRPGA